MSAHNKAQLTHAMINCTLKDSNYDSHLSKMLKFAILALNASSVQERYLNALTTKMIPYSHIMFQHFSVPESHTTFTLTKMNTCMSSPIGLPLFSNQHSFQLTQDHKGLFKACNGDECKGIWIEEQSKDTNSKKGTKQAKEMKKGEHEAGQEHSACHRVAHLTT
uniref:Uncharacterized protein n=1 Tax=Solanum tuberosum TaxID=4113 RepID=M1DUY4_SOLTU